MIPPALPQTRQMAKRAGCVTASFAGHVERSPRSSHGGFLVVASPQESRSVQILIEKAGLKAVQASPGRVI